MSVHDPIPAPGSHVRALSHFRDQLTLVRDLEDADGAVYAAACDVAVTALDEVLAIPATSASQLAEKLHSALNWHEGEALPRTIVEQAMRDAYAISADDNVIYAWVNAFTSLKGSLITAADGTPKSVGIPLVLTAGHQESKRNLPPHLVIRDEVELMGAMKVLQILLLDCGERGKRAIFSFGWHEGATYRAEPVPAADTAWQGALNEYERLRAESDAMPLGTEGEDAAVDAYCAAMDHLIINVAAPDFSALRHKFDLAFGRSEDFGSLAIGYAASIKNDLDRLIGREG